MEMEVWCEMAWYLLWYGTREGLLPRDIKNRILDADGKRGFFFGRRAEAAAGMGTTIFMKMNTLFLFNLDFFY